MTFDVERRKEWMKDYYQKNRDKLIEYSKKYQKEHRQQNTTRMLYKPQGFKCYKDDGITNTIFEKKKINYKI